MGLSLRGASYAGHYLIADIHWGAGPPTERRVWFDPPASPGQTIILHQQPDDIWRFDCQLPPDADPAAELEETRLRRRIATHLDWLGNTEPWTIEWASVYSARALSLDEYVHGRVLFAGDAAHMVPIFGGALEGFAAALRSRLGPAVGCAVLIPDDGERLARALGVAPAEVLLVRPDGLLLARYASAGAGRPGGTGRAHPARRKPAGGHGARTRPAERQ